MSELEKILKENGLNIYLEISRDILPSNLIEEFDIHLPKFKSINLIGNGGKDFWIKNESKLNLDSINPIDDFCKKIFYQNFNLKNNRLLYPEVNKHLSLIELSSLINFSHSTPLGIHISQHYGVWFAFRMLVISLDEVSLPINHSFSSPCHTCHDQNCISSCPASATKISGFQISNCAEFRLKTASPCQFNCMARINCPYKVEMTYPQEQLNYHMMHSFKILLDLNKLKS